MSKIFTKVNSLVLFAIMAFGIFLSSCQKDDVDPTVQLWSFGPSPAKHGEQIKFIGTNLDKVTAILLPGDVEITSFVTQKSDLIVLQLPDETLEGKVILKTPQGNIETKTILGFDVPIAITAVSPQLVKPGENLTIQGDFMNWVKEVHFYDGKVVTEFVSQSLNQLVVMVPMDAQTGPLMVSGGDRETITFQLEEDLQVALPVLTAIAPTSLKHLDELTLTGTNLDLVKEIIFPGAPEGTLVSTFVSQSADELVVQVPNYAVQGSLTMVAHSLVEVPTIQEFSLILPALTNATPNPVDPNTSLTLTGTNLDLVKSVQFTGGATVSTFESQSATEIVFIVPENALKGVLTLITIHDYAVKTTQDIKVTGDLPPLGPLAYPMYTDAIASGWEDWGWGGPSVWNSTEIVREGEFAAKKAYDGSYDAIRVHASAENAVSTDGYTSLVFSVFGAPGTGGQNMQLVINEQWGAPYVFPIVEGEWTTYSILLSDLGSPATINDVLFQSAGWAGEVHYDHIGLQ